MILKKDNFILSQLFIFVLWFFAIIVITHVPLFKINQVDCQLSNLQPCPADLEEIVRAVKNQKIVLTQVDQRISQALKNTINYQLLATQFFLPDKLTLTFQPITYAYEIKSDLIAGTVSDQGHVLTNERQPENLPSVVVDSASSSAVILNTSGLDTINPAFHNIMIYTIAELKKIGENPRELYYYSKHKLQARLENNLVITLDTDQIAPNLRRFQLIRSNKTLADEFSSSSELDLRFTLPILRNIN